MELSIEQVANALNLPIETVERWVRQGRIPYQLQEGETRFRQRVLEKWATQLKLPFQVTTEQKGGDLAIEADTVHKAMRRGGVYYDIEGADTESALRHAVAKLSRLDLSEADRGILLTRLLEREAMASTGVGKGVAIPHPRTPLDEAVPYPTICTFFLETAAAFQAIDDKPVFVLFLLLSPSTQSHLHCLSRLAFCVRDDGFVTFLRSHPTPDALYERVATFEQQLDTP
jgi:PTS system nitrogen regulatory IIA component